MKITVNEVNEILNKNKIDHEVYIHDYMATVLEEKTPQLIPFLGTILPEDKKDTAIMGVALDFIMILYAMVIKAIENDVKDFKLGNDVVNLEYGIFLKIIEDKDKTKYTKYVGTAARYLDTECPAIAKFIIMCLVDLSVEDEVKSIFTTFFAFFINAIKRNFSN